MLRIFIIFTIILILSPVSGICETSYYANGFGLIEDDDNGTAASMGDAGIALTGFSNLMRGNPALLSSYTKATYLGGISYNRNKAYTGREKNSTFAETVPDYLKIIIPFRKSFVMGWGLAPYSRTDVKTVFKSADYTDEVSFKGGLNVSTTTLAYSYKNILKIGMSLDYTFGVLEEDWVRTFNSDDDYSNNEMDIRHKYSSYTTTYGFILSPYKNFSIGAGYTGKSDIKRRDYMFRIKMSSPYKYFGEDNLDLPSQLRIGAAYSGKKLSLAMDYKYDNWKDAATTDDLKEMYNNSHMFGAGFRYIHSNEIFAPFYKKIPISAGFKFGNLYYKSYPDIAIVPEKAITAGFEVPLGLTKGTVITSFEFGKRGEKSKNGWDENYMEMSVLLVGVIK